MISPHDMHLFHLTDDAEDAVNEVLHFYRVYHSSRFVRKEFVMRLNRPLRDDLIDQLNDEYADLLTDGRFRLEPQALPEEGGEYPDKPRLVFHFNRNSIGRLRMLIDTLNAGVPRKSDEADLGRVHSGGSPLNTDDEENSSLNSDDEQED